MTRLTLLAGLVLAAGWLLHAGSLKADNDARDLGVDADGLVEVELATVGVNPVTRSPVVLLRNLETGDVVPIFIGVAEARAILLAMQGEEMPRPMTHDLFGNVLSAADITLERVLVDDLIDGTYLGMLELRIAGREDPLRVDSRPSDALALAVRAGATILVAPKILVAGEGMEYEGLERDQVVTALGITVVEVTARLRDALQLPDRGGVLVNRSRGRAAELGLGAGSLILEVNGRTPDSPMNFLELVRQTDDDARVEIRYWQDGEEHTLRLDHDEAAPALDEDSRLEV